MAILGFQVGRLNVGSKPHSKRDRSRSQQAGISFGGESLKSRFAFDDRATR